MPDKDKIFDNILSDIEAVSNETVEEYSLVSSDKKIKFKPLTLGQQSRVLTDTITTEGARLDTNIKLNEVIVENCQDGSELKAIDREYILLQMKRGLTGSKLTVFIDDDNPVEVDLDIHLDNCKKLIKEMKIEQVFVVDVDDIKVTCRLPSLERDTEIIRYNQELFQNVDVEQTTENQATANAINLAYLGELAKHINTVSVGESIIDFASQLTIEQQYKVLENLPYNITSEISKYIASVTENINKLILYTHETETPIAIEVSAQIFSVE